MLLKISKKTPWWPKRLPSDEHTGESWLPIGEYSGGLNPPVMKTPGSLKSPVMNTPGVNVLVYLEQASEKVYKRFPSDK
jgi:hypothetical protein